MIIVAALASGLKLHTRAVLLRGFGCAYLGSRIRAGLADDTKELGEFRISGTGLAAPLCDHTLEPVDNLCEQT